MQEMSIYSKKRINLSDNVQFCISFTQNSQTALSIDTCQSFCIIYCLSSYTTRYDNSNSNSNSNNNTNANVYGTIIMAEPLREFTRFI